MTLHKLKIRILGKLYTESDVRCTKVVLHSSDQEELDFDRVAIVHGLRIVMQMKIAQTVNNI